MRTFLLMLGSAVCGVILFVAAVYGYFWWQWSQVEPGTTVRFPPRNETSVAEVPPLSEKDRFYGTQGSYSGEFPHGGRQKVLAAGPGKIVGRVSKDGKPVEGVRLRLALNGAVMSQWATTGRDGRYEVALPFGKYRVDGYELDSSVAQKVLAGKIDGPLNHSSPQLMTVAQDRAGEGIDLSYVDPVRKIGPVGDVSRAKPVVISWEAYPGASAYRLQLVEQKDRRDFQNHVRLFDWSQRPVVTGTSLDLSAQKVPLKKGYYYAVEIEALGDLKRILSQSARHFDTPDFRVID
jgi:hypothetical protein